MKSWLKRCALAVAASLIFASPGAHSAPQVTVLPYSLPQASITSVSGSIPNSSTTVTLTDYSTNIIIWTSSDAANLYVNPANTTATTGNAIVYPGAGLMIRTVPIKQFKILGASATGTYNVIAY